MNNTFFIYESLPDIVSFRYNNKAHTCTWEKFSNKYSPPFNVSNIFSINYEPERKIFVVCLIENNETIFGEQSLEINWIKANWNNFIETFSELTQEQITLSVSEKKRELLFETDWIVQRHQEQALIDAPTSITQDQFYALLSYRQLIRDIDASEDPETSITWPTYPF